MSRSRYDDRERRRSSSDDSHHSNHRYDDERDSRRHYDDVDHGHSRFSEERGPNYGYEEDYRHNSRENHHSHSSRSDEFHSRDTQGKKSRYSSHRCENDKDVRDYHDRDRPSERQDRSPPRRQLQSYRDTDAPSECLLLRPVSVNVNEDQVADCLKPFAPLISVRRLFDEEGHPINEVVAEYMTVLEASKAFDLIRRAECPLRINYQTPSISYWRPTRPIKRHDARDGPEDEPESDNEKKASPRPDLNLWQRQLAIIGLPLEFNSPFELETMVTHILMAPHPRAVIERIELVRGERSLEAIVSFTDSTHLHELMRRTFGSVVLRAFHLSLQPVAPPRTEDAPDENAILAAPLPSDLPLAMPHAPPLHIIYRYPTKLPPHPLAPSDHDYVWTDAGLRDLTCGLLFNHLAGVFVDDSGQQVPFDDPRLHTLLSDPKVQDGPSSEHHISGEEVNQAPVNFSIAPTKPKPTAGKSSSLSASTSMSTAASSSQTAANLAANPMTAPTRGGRHFVNIPADKPARATLPPPTNQDLPFTRGTICILCRLEFATPEQTKRHAKESSLHRSNLDSLHVEPTTMPRTSLPNGTLMPNLSESEHPTTKKRTRGEAAMPHEDERSPPPQPALELPSHPVSRP